jgi:hypothetical protein
MTRIAIDLTQLITAEARAAERAAAHRAALTAAIDAHVEGVARAAGYNGAAALAGYVASTVPDWAAEARAFVAWRDAVWTAALEMLAAADPVAPAPAPAEVLALLLARAGERPKAAPA